MGLAGPQQGFDPVAVTFESGGMGQIPEDPALGAARGKLPIDAQRGPIERFGLTDISLPEEAVGETALAIGDDQNLRSNFAGTIRSE